MDTARELPNWRVEECRFDTKGLPACGPFSRLSKGPSRTPRTWANTFWERLPPGTNITSPQFCKRTFVALYTNSAYRSSPCFSFLNPWPPSAFTCSMARRERTMGKMIVSKEDYLQPSTLQNRHNNMEKHCIYTTEEGKRFRLKHY